METSTKLLTGIVISVLLIVTMVTVIFVEVSTSLGPEQAALEECKSYKYSGPHAFNLLYFADKETTERYAKFFLDTPPYNEKKDDFNIYYIDDYEINCETYQDVAILCYSKEAVQKAASCPNDFIISVVDAGPDLRSSAYLNFVSINKNHPLSVQTHELGHAIGNLAEEYINNKNPARGSKNCLEICSEFSGMEEGCYEGCSRRDLTRSIENGVMRTLSSNEYGTYNEDIVLGVINSVQESPRPESAVTGFAVEDAMCKDNFYYLIEIKNGQVTSKTLENGCAPENSGDGPDKYNVLSRDGNIQESKDFNILIFTDDYNEGEESLSGESFDPEEIIFAIPAKEADDSLAIFQGEEQILETSLFDVGARPCEI